MSKENPPNDRVVHLVVDTSALQGDWSLSGLAIETCLFASRTNRIVLCFPEVVVLELSRHYREAFDTAYDGLKKAQRTLERLTGHRAGGMYDILADFGHADQEATLRKRLTRDNVRVLPIPEISHQRILNRDLGRRKPFADDGRGYRDALIWHSVLTLARTGVPVVFASKNLKDFAASDRDVPSPKLHPDLASDLEHRKLSADAVILATNLIDAVTTHARFTPNGELVEEIAESRERQKILAEALIREKNRFVRRVVDRGAQAVSPLEVESVVAVVGIRPTSAHAMDDSRTVLLAFVTLDVRLSVRIGLDDEATDLLHRAATVFRGGEYIDVAVAFFLDRSGHPDGIDIGSIRHNHEIAPFPPPSDLLASAPEDPAPSSTIPDRSDD